MPYITRITTKGQVVIPKEFRDRDGVHTGDSLKLVSDDQGIRIAPRSGWAKATAGCLAGTMRSLEPDELDELAESAAIQEAREEYGMLG